MSVMALGATWAFIKRGRFTSLIETKKNNKSKIIKIKS